MKQSNTQPLATRQPRQERARHKVALILEAAMRLLDKGGFALLTTNAVAETAGVSIGTLYQYFPNKEAILEALAAQEMAEMSRRVLVVLNDPAEASREARIGRIIRAVVSSYGERPRVHRLVLEHSLARGGGLAMPLIEEIIALLTSPDRPAVRGPMTKAEAFVITNAIVGVMRAMIVRPDASEPPQGELEEAMGRLIVSFVERD